MQPTKTQRRYLYKRAYILIDNGSDTCICWALFGELERAGLILIIDFGYITPVIIERFPEFEMFEPMRNENRYWFSSKEERLIALGFMIAMTETN